MQVYTRKINYHETDKMGITHHSNYIKFMEEARVDFLEKIGLPFETVEAQDIGSPVTALEIDYKNSTTFSDVINIEVSIEEYTGVKIAFSYLMKNGKTGEIVATAKSRHCFIKDGKFYSFKRDKNPMDEKLEAAFKTDKE